jgi:lipopolysaccharide export system permease protein
MTRPALLRRYLGGKFLTAIAGAFLFCCILIFMIDFLEMLRQAGKNGNVPISRVILITALRLPSFTEILLAFAVLVGSIATLLLLSRKSELAVMRAGGLSVWQLLRPGIVVAFVIGVFAVTVYNPFATYSRGEAERIHAITFGRESNFLTAQTGGLWLRQDGADGPTVVTAAATTKKGLELHRVTMIQFDARDEFQERVDGDVAILLDGHWAITNAIVTRIGVEPERYPSYLISTNLTPARVHSALESVLSISFWDLPELIAIAEKTNIDAASYRMQYAMLWSRPWLLAAMVFLAATVSLRSFRSGGIQTMVIVGMIGGIGLFLLVEVSRQVGVAGLVPAWVAVWVPVGVAGVLAMTVLLHQEDG